MFGQVVRYTPNASTQAGQYAAGFSLLSARLKGNLPPAPTLANPPHFFIIGDTVGPQYLADSIMTSPIGDDK